MNEITLPLQKADLTAIIAQSYADNAFIDHNIVITTMLIYGKRGMIVFEESDSENR
jgi:hypothetical protein